MSDCRGCQTAMTRISWAEADFVNMARVLSRKPSERIAAIVRERKAAVAREKANRDEHMANEHAGVSA